MRYCWAATHSACSGKISREHYVSSSVFEQQSIFVQGFHWCAENEKEVSVASITAKILCQSHNSALSPVDQAGAEAVRAFESTWPTEIRSMDTTNAKLTIDGPLMERWLLKTAINVSVNGGYHIGLGMTDSQVGQPSPYLLAVAFGELPFSHKMGLYTLFPGECQRMKAGSFSVYPLRKNGSLGAFVFHVRGFDFLLNLFPGHAPPCLRELGINRDPGGRHYLLDCNPQYRIRSMVSRNDVGGRHEIFIKW